jgi:hypothetical protein
MSPFHSFRSALAEMFSIEFPRTVKFLNAEPAIDPKRKQSSVYRDEEELQK